MTPIEEDAHNLRQLVDTLRMELTQERQRARSRELARVAVSQLDVDPERALLLALEAITSAVTYESRDALQQAVLASRLRWVFAKAGEARIRHAYFAKDNRHIITAGQDGVLRWWDLDAKKEIDALQCCEGPIEKILLSPLRDRALVTSLNTQSGQYWLLIVDLSERKALAAIEDETLPQEDVINSTAFFSQDGRRLVVNTEYWTDLSLWDTTSGVRLYKAGDVGCCHGLDREGRRALLTRPDFSVAIMDVEDEGRTTLLNVPNEKVKVTSFTDLLGPVYGKLPCVTECPYNEV